MGRRELMGVDGGADLFLGERGRGKALERGREGWKWRDGRESERQNLVGMETWSSSLFRSVERYEGESTQEISGLGDRQRSNTTSRFTSTRLGRMRDPSKNAIVWM
jgi:hypothetical protein